MRGFGSGTLVSLLLLVTTGCGLVNQLKQDAAIVGATGFSLSIGFDPTPENAMIPLPKVKLMYGTAWRVGIHDCIFISNAAGAGAYVGNLSLTPPAGAPGTAPAPQPADTTRANCIPTAAVTAVGGPSPPGATGNAMLTISASGLEALKELKWVAP